MAIREIITAPDPRLKEVSKPVDKVDDGLRAHGRHAGNDVRAPGIGLAAIQVGVPKQDRDGPRARRREAPAALFHQSRNSLDSDGGLYEEAALGARHVRGCRASARSACAISTIRARSAGECDELLATCLQHEMDHLKGILFIDPLRASSAR